MKNELEGAREVGRAVRQHGSGPSEKECLLRRGSWQWRESEADTLEKYLEI